MQKLGVGGGPSSKPNCTSRTKKPLGAPGIAAPSSTNSQREGSELLNAVLCPPTPSATSPAGSPMKDLVWRRSSQRSPVSGPQPRSLPPPETGEVLAGRRAKKCHESQNPSPTPRRSPIVMPDSQGRIEEGWQWAGQEREVEKTESKEMPSATAAPQGIPYLEA